MFEDRIESSSAEQAAQQVHDCGVSVWRGSFPLDLAAACLEAIAARYQDETSFVTQRRGVMKPETLPPHLRDRIVTPEIADAFRRMLGGEFQLEDGHSPIFLVHAGLPRVWTWHQDASVMPSPCASAWIPLTPCGYQKAAPGLEFALSPKRAPHPVLFGESIVNARFKEDVVKEQGFDICIPALDAGDVLYFDSFSIHRTHVAPAMDKVRAAIRLSAFPKGEGGAGSVQLTASYGA